MQFISQNLTDKYISSSYQDILQQYSQPGFLYVLDGFGNVVFSIPSASVGQVLITSDATSSMTVASASVSSVVELYKESSSFASSSISASYSQTSSISYLAMNSIDSVNSIFSDTSSVSLYSDFSGTSSVSLQSETASYLDGINQSLIPSVDRVYDLGSVSNRWKDIFVGTGSIYLGPYRLSFDGGILRWNGHYIALVDTSSHIIHYEKNNEAVIATASIAQNSRNANSSHFSDSSSMSQTSTTSSYVFGNIWISQSIDFTPNTSSVPPWREGRLFWDELNHTLGLYTDQNQVTLQVGQETYIRVIAREYIPDGCPVCVVTSKNTFPVVELALSNGLNNYRHRVIGISTQTINSGSQGFITVQGRVNGIDTSDYVEGSELYLSNVHSGSFTTTPPILPYEQVICGYCLYSHNTDGKLLVNLVPHFQTTLSSSYSETASIALTAINGGTQIITASLIPITSSWAQNALEAVTASFALNSGQGGTQLVTASLYEITSSWSKYAETASFIYTIPSGSTESASYAQSASHATVAERLVDSGLTIPQYDYSVVAYDGPIGQVSTCTYKRGGISGSIVAIVTAIYDGNTFTGVSKSLF